MTKTMMKTRCMGIVPIVVFQLLQLTFAQTEEFDKCISALNAADTNENSRLEKDPEYLQFVTEFTDGNYHFSSFDDLPVQLQMSFGIFQEGDEIIDIRGATHSAKATPEQHRIVETLCTTTRVTLAGLPMRSHNESNVTEPPLTNTTQESQSTYTYPMSPGQDPVLYPEGDMAEPGNMAASGDITEWVPTDYPTSTSTVAMGSANRTDAISATDIQGVTEEPSNQQVTTAPTENPPSTAIVSSPNRTSTDPIANTTDTSIESIQPPISTETPSNATESPLTTAAPNATNSDITSTAEPTNATTITQTPTTSNATSTRPTVSPTPVPSDALISSNQTSNITTSQPTDTSELPLSINGTDLSNNVNATDLSINGNVTELSNETASSSDIVLMEPSNENSTAWSNETNNVTSGSLPTAVPTQDPYSECKRVMKFSDINEDGIMNKLEYVWFINDNWNNPYPGIAFKNLPKGLKDNFDNLATEDGIDIAIINSENDTSDERDDFLDKICSDTEIAVSQEEPYEEFTEEGAAMDIFKDCLVSVTLLDDDGDTFLNRNEYAALFSELSDGQIGKNGFKSLPLIVEDSFYALATGTTIDLGGAKEGEKIKSSQQEILEEICIEISYSLHASLQDITEGGFLEEETNTDTEFMLEYGECFVKMNTYDIDQNSKLDEEEYTGLVNHLAKDQFQGQGFKELDEILQNNFLNLETNGYISIDGSQTEQIPDAKQQKVLGQICAETSTAVNTVLEKLNASSDASNVEDVTTTMNSIVIHSSFHIYSDVFISEEEFESGLARSNLDEAFMEFASEVVSGLAREKRSADIRRQEEDKREESSSIILVPGSPAITKIIDLNCMASSIDAICKTVFGQYEIIPSDEMNRDEIYEEYVRVTQAFIDAGMLQRDIEQVNPQSMIEVIGASEPVIFTRAEPTPAPVTQLPLYTDQDDNEGNVSSRKKKIVALVAVVVGCILLISLMALTYVRYHKRYGSGSTSSSLETRSSGLGKSESDTDSKDEEEARQGGHSQSGESIGSQGTPKSGNIFRSRCGDQSHSGDADSHAALDEEFGKMQVIDLCEGTNTTSYDYKEVSNVHMRNLAKKYQQEEENECSALPPLRRKKDDHVDHIQTAESDEISFAFRRFALDGGKVNTEDEHDHNDNLHAI